MEPDEEELRRMWAASSAWPTGDHPDEAAWTRLATGEVQSAERADLFAHASACSECAAIYRGVEEFREAARFAPGAPRRWSVPNRRWLLAAAALVLVVAAPLLLHGPLERRPIPAAPADQPDSLRGAPASRPRALSPAGRLQAVPRELRWQAAPGAASHRVEILAPDGNVLWQSGEVAGTSLAWPPQLELRPGRYYWRVIAVAAAGAPPNPSPLVSFEIAP